MTIALLSRSLIVAAALVVLAACSTVRIAYHGADILIRQYADDYLALDAELAAAWEPELTQALARHKAEELPFLASFVDGALRAAERGFDRATVDCLQDQALVIYQRHARLAADLAAPLLASGGPGQLRTLEARFRQDWQEEASAEPLAVARRERKRAKRYAEAARWWVGGLSPAQEAIVQSATASMPDTAPAWEAYRRSRQSGLLRLLREGAREDKIRSYLTDWLADHDDIPAGLAQAGQGIRDAITELVVRLGASFSAEQEALLLRRLRGLREDFLALQAKPRFAGPGCK